MLTRFTTPPLWQSTRLLAGVASARSTPELVITGARILNTYSEQFLEDRELWIAAGRIAAVRPAGSCSRNSGARFYDARGGILAPGLVDPHLHIESSMMTACAYAEVALLNGTTTIFCDSHEIGNVLDVEGIEWMLQDAREAPLNIFLTLPSTIPATHPGIETCGGDLTPEKAGILFDKWPEIVALGEKMDFVPVCSGDLRSHAIIAEALKRNKVVSGHVYGREFVAAYAASGISDTHEAIDPWIASDLLESGVWIFLRGGPPTTPWHSLPQAIKAMTEMGASTKRVCVCTDDRDADDLYMFGMDWVVKQAQTAGIKPAQAWSLGSLHGATRFAMDGEIGGLGGGRRADVVLLDDELSVKNTWFAGELVVEDGKVTALLDAQLSKKRYVYPKAAYHTVKLPDSLQLVPDMPIKDCTVHLLRAESPGIVTLHRTAAYKNGADNWNAFLEVHECCHLAVIERYGKSGAVAHGFLQNFGLRSGAVASSVGHDAHNLVVAGTNERDMQIAITAIREHQGAVVVVDHGKVVSLVPLPVAGLISDKRAGEVAAQVTQLKAAWNAAGCKLPYMGFNLLPLSVIPDFRLTDKGLVLVQEMKLQPLFT